MCIMLVGVCDCCDGSDENSPYTKNKATHHCQNTCDLEIMKLKQAALAMHRNIQAGQRAKTEITETFKASRSKMYQQLENMQLEYNLIDKLLFRAMYLLKVCLSLFCFVCSLYEAYLTFIYVYMLMCVCCSQLSTGRKCGRGTGAVCSAARALEPLRPGRCGSVRHWR
jgi:hypothetical protein